MGSDYQFLRPLTSDENSRLKASIHAFGVMMPVVTDEGENVLDGHHRVRICEELGIKEYPVLVRSGLTEEQKRALVIELNDARRQMSQEERRKMIEQHLKAAPERSDRQIAEAVGVSHPTVSSVRADLTKTGDVERLSTSTDTLGRQQPRARKPATAAIKPSALTDKERKRVDAERHVVANPQKSNVELGRELGLPRQTVRGIRLRMIEAGRIPNPSASPKAINEKPKSDLIRQLEAVDTSSGDMGLVNGRMWLPHQPPMAAHTLMCSYYTKTADRMFFLESFVAGLGVKELRSLAAYTTEILDRRLNQGHKEGQPDDRIGDRK